MVTIDEEYTEAEIYKQTTTKTGVLYLAKVSFTDIGLYISGITVRRSNKEGEEWWIQLPAYPIGKGKYFTPFEVNQSMPFWLHIKDKVQEALTVYMTDTEVVTEFDSDKPITVDDFNWPA